jgi:hypothetical protein
MSEPTPVPILAGDWKDDDGQVLDSFLEENTDESRRENAPTSEPFVPAQERPKETTRLLGTTTSVVAGASPQQVLLGDVDRRAVHLHITTALATDLIRYSHDPGMLNEVGGQYAPSLLASQPIDGMLHTGPLYVYAPAANSAPVSVSVTSVTI